MDTHSLRRGRLRNSADDTALSKESKIKSNPLFKHQHLIFRLLEAHLAGKDGFEGMKETGSRNL